MATEVHALCPADSLDLARLHLSCFSLDQAWSQNSFAELLADPGLVGWRVCEDGRTIALLLARLIIDEAELLTLAVSSRHRRQGLAQALLQRLSDELRRRHALKIFLEVAENNEAALQLYQKAGYKLISRRWNYYPGGLSAHVLLKELF